VSNTGRSPRSVRRLVVTCYEATVIGAVALGVYFVLFRGSSGEHPLGESAQHALVFRIATLSTLGNILFAIGLWRLVAGLQYWEDRLHAGASPSDVPLEVRRRVLNLVPRVTLLSVSIWILMAVVAIVASPVGGGGLARVIRLSVGIAGAGGVVTPTVLYFAADLTWRPVVHTFFPDGRMSAVSPSRRPILVPLVLAFLLSGVWLPALLVVASLSPKPEMVGSVRTVEFVLLGACIIVTMTLTVLVTRSIVAPVRALQRAMAQVEQNDLEVVVPVTTNDELGYLGERFNQMTAGLREREHIRRMFGQYVTTQVAEAVLRGEVKVGGERTEVTILMTDLRDFTSLCESIEPEEVVALLNRYFDAMIDAILEFGGTLDKFVGDSIVTVFNAPLALPDHAFRAVLTAVRMRERLAAFNADQRVQGQPELRMGMGIHTGPAVVGNIGSEGKRVEYTAMGDTVNVAARLEGLTKELGGDLYLSEETYRQVRERVVVDAPVSTTVKGRHTPLRVCRVIDVRPTYAPTVRITPGVREGVQQRVRQALERDFDAPTA